MEELSKKLRERRKELGYDLEDVVEKTKLHPSVIRALETGQFHKISHVYLKGFIKIYAEFLGVDISDELERVIPTKASSMPVSEPRKVSPKKRDLPIVGTGSYFKKNVVFAAVIAVSFVIIFILIFSILRLVHDKGTSLESKPVVKEHTKTATELKVNAEEILVSFKIKRDCFIVVKRDGKVVFEGILKRGVIETWQANKELEFKINDGSSVEVEVNGRRLPPLTKIHKPIKSLKITAKGISIIK